MIIKLEVNGEFRQYNNKAYNSRRIENSFNNGNIETMMVVKKMRLLKNFLNLF